MKAASGSVVRTETRHLYLDKNDANLLHDEVTTTDHAFTKP
jgi:hypothetical protein